MLIPTIGKSMHSMRAVLISLFTLDTNTTSMVNRNPSGNILKEYYPTLDGIHILHNFNGHPSIQGTSPLSLAMWFVEHSYINHQTAPASKNSLIRINITQHTFSTLASLFNAREKSIFEGRATTPNILPKFNIFSHHSYHPLKWRNMQDASFRALVLGIHSTYPFLYFSSISLCQSESWSIPNLHHRFPRRATFLWTSLEIPSLWLTHCIPSFQLTLAIFFLSHKKFLLICSSLPITPLEALKTQK